jgi:hypothetical protein
MSRGAARRERSVVGIANEKVPITLACRLIGLDLADDIAYGRSLKIHCPFGEIYHVDQGHEAAMRIYPDTNSAFCFAGCGYFSPVWLLAQAWDIDPTQAAVELLERAGIKPVSLAQAWAEASIVDAEPDRTALCEALKMYCRRTVPGWNALQFQPEVARTLARCLTLLDRVRTEDDAQRWLRVCKQVMAHETDREGVYK